VATIGCKIKDGGKLTTVARPRHRHGLWWRPIRERKAGTSAKVRTRKQDKGRYRSAAALEMMMAERLAEQAFEMCFSDPPAELAAVKGAPLLAELKPPPGLAPVRAKGANASAPRVKTT
jgi:hypothetical protein